MFLWTVVLKYCRKFGSRTKTRDIRRSQPNIYDGTVLSSQNSSIVDVRIQNTPMKIYLEHQWYRKKWKSVTLYLFYLYILNPNKEP